MNIYEKMEEAKVALQKKDLKKTGLNKFSGYKYYELGDFMPAINEICRELKLFTRVNFEADFATLTIIDIEKTDDMLIYKSEMVKTSLKGCNEIQTLGGVQTYQRRYLYMNAFEISENDYYIDGKEDSKEDNDNKEDSIFSEDKETDDESEKIDKLKKDLLDDAIAKNNLSDEIVYKVLDSYGYSSTAEIEIKNYMAIVNDFKKITGSK